MKVLEGVWKVSACCKEGSGEYKESLLKARSSQDRCCHDKSSQNRSSHERSSPDMSSKNISCQDI